MIFFLWILWHGFLLELTLVELRLLKNILIWTIFFKCVSGLPFVEIDFGRIAMVKNISCIASLCCLSFIKHIYSETWCSVLCIFYSRCLYALYGVVSVSCESTYTFVIYIYIYGSIWVQEQIKTNFSLCCYSIWFGHVGFADGTCLLVANIPGVTVRYTCGAGVLSSAVGCMC